MLKLTHLFKQNFFGLVPPRSRHVFADSYGEMTEKVSIMRSFLSAVLATLCLLAGASSASANYAIGGAFGDRSYGGGATSQPRIATRSSRSSRSRGYTRYASTGNSWSGGGYNAGPRPGRWCGWWMRTQKGGGPHLNVAWNWSKWGRPTSPQVGAVVVWRHHVGMIVGRAANGQWLVKSGNDGGRIRTRARSVSGAVFRI